MRLLRDDEGVVVLSLFKAFRLECFFVQSYRGCSHIEDVGDRSSHASSVSDVSAHYIVSYDPGLLVSRTCQRYHRLFARHEVIYLYYISDCPDMRRRSVHHFVHHDASAGIELKAGSLRKFAVRFYSYREDHEISIDLLAACKNDARLSVRFLEMIDAVSEAELNAVFFYVLVQDLRHLRIEWSHDLIESFDEAHIDSSRVEVLSHLETDEASADNDGLFRFLHIDQSLDPVDIVHVPEDLYALSVDARDRRTDRRGSRRDDELVVRLFVFAFRSSDRHRLLLRIDSESFTVDPDIYVPRGLHLLRILEQKLLPVNDHVTHVIRQSAVCEADVSAPFEHDYLSIIIEPSQPCRSAGSSGYSSDYKYLHITPPGHYLQCII